MKISEKSRRRLPCARCLDRTPFKIAIGITSKSKFWIKDSNIYEDIDNQKWMLLNMFMMKKKKGIMGIYSNTF